MKTKQALGWHWPADEWEATQWMEKPANKLPLNGRDTYQGKKQVAALAACKSFRTAVDVGAHVGLWSYNLAFKFNRVEAFEPVALHRECFAKNVTAANVHMHAVALGALPGTCSIESRPGVSGDSQVRSGTEIPMVQLDSFQLQDVDLIKVDCEGFEENVLVGACDTILKWKPTIIVEQKRDMATRFGLKPQGALAVLHDMGYKTLQEIGGDFIMVPK